LLRSIRPTRARRPPNTSVDQTEARNGPRTDYVSHCVRIGHCEIGGFE
jgi:hypothetical protein